MKTKTKEANDYVLSEKIEWERWVWQVSVNPHRFTLFATKEDALCYIAAYHNIDPDKITVDTDSNEVWHNGQFYGCMRILDVWAMPKESNDG